MPASQPQRELKNERSSFWKMRVPPRWRHKIAVLAILVIVILVIWTALTLNDTFGIKDVRIVVEYDHHWTGGDGQWDVENALSMTGNYSHVWHWGYGGHWTADVHAQKDDGSNATLRVWIETLDGRILKSATTSEPYGMVQLDMVL